MQKIMEVFGKEITTGKSIIAKIETSPRFIKLYGSVIEINGSMLSVLVGRVQKVCGQYEDVKEEFVATVEISDITNMAA